MLAFMCKTQLSDVCRRWMHVPGVTQRGTGDSGTHPAYFWIEAVRQLSIIGQVSLQTATLGATFPFFMKTIQCQRAKLFYFHRKLCFTLICRTIIQLQTIVQKISSNCSSRISKRSRTNLNYVSSAQPFTLKFISFNDVNFFYWYASYVRKATFFYVCKRNESSLLILPNLSGLC